MPTPGYMFRDGGPIPDSDLTEQPTLENNPPGQTPTRTPTRASTSNSSNALTPTSSNSTASAPSDSHALAHADHDEKGVAQQGFTEGEVRNVGWNEHPGEVDNLVGGLPNAEVWTLVRRFNKQMYHVKATPAPLLGGLDCNIVDEDEFSPDKLRSNVERLYMTVIIGLIGFGKHIARLRSWREPRRTGAFLAVSDAIEIMLGVLMALTGLCNRLDLQFHHAAHYNDGDCFDCVPSLPTHPLPACTLGSCQFQNRWRPVSCGRCAR